MICLQGGYYDLSLLPCQPGPIQWGYTHDTMVFSKERRDYQSQPARDHTLIRSRGREIVYLGVIW